MGTFFGNRRNNLYRVSVVGLCFVCLLATSASAGRVRFADDGRAASGIGAAEKSVGADAAVTLLICMETGDVVVRGWDRQEVRARSNDAERVELRRADATVEPNPATRIEVLVAKNEEEPARPGLCSNSGNLELDVPRGSLVQIKGNAGDVNVSEVANARVKTLSGDIDLHRVARSIEAWSANGEITVSDSSGRVRLETISGGIGASDLRTSDAGDELTAKTVSGDIELSRIAHTHVEALSTSSPIDFAGQLAHGGLYIFKSHAGNVTLALAPDASFQLNANVYESGEIVAEFPIRQMPATKSDDPKDPRAMGGMLLNGGRLTGLAGKNEKGDATLILSSFSGRVHLQKGVR